MDLEQLKLQLKSRSISDIVNKFILHGDPICLGGNSDLIMQLKRSLSDHFDIHIKNIEIVGSSKLGVSLSEERFGKPFDKNSDIDMVIVSSELFDIGWHELLKLEFEYHKLRPKDRDTLKDCYETTHRGYISPENLPVRLNFAKHWWYIFSQLSSQEKYEYRKVRGRLFRNWWFAEKYYSIQIIKLYRLRGEKQ